MKIFSFLLLITFITYSQSDLLFDGRFEDWDFGAPVYVDPDGDGTNHDFKYFSAANDEKFLYIRLKVTPEFKLIEDNNLVLYIDTDNNDSTGVSINGIGADLVWNFGERKGSIHTPLFYNIFHDDISFAALPSVSAEENEFIIGRVDQLNGTPLFISDTIRIQFKDNSPGGDLMPDDGDSFIYIFDNTIQSAYQPVEIMRKDSAYLRVMNYNILFDGITNQSKYFNFKRILNAIKPDVICFNEVFNSSSAEVQTTLNDMLPLPEGSWETIKLDGGNVTASKYPIMQNWIVYPGSRITASLIDLSQKFNTNILLINSHFKCCGGISNDNRRQKEADAVIEFILDAKSPGGLITLPEYTPIVILGDLNLVGDSQQLTTLLTGEIINTGEFGSGGFPDWDNSTLEDLYSFQTDLNAAFTWNNINSSFSAGRLDFMIYTNSSIEVKKSFILRTEVMTDERLQQYELSRFDTESASDHFPKIADFSLGLATDINSEEKSSINYRLFQNYPNPFNPSTTISYSVPKRSHITLKFFDVLGKEVAELKNDIHHQGTYTVEFNASHLPSGVYFYQLRSEDFISDKKMLLLK
jgi:endonuclease/exonuclease/phosphatase family metal-dependent hydrolase